MRTLAIMVSIIIVFASTTFASEKAPQIIQFSNSWSGSNQNGKASENAAIKEANEWLKKNFKKVNVLSHSVSGNSGIAISDELEFSTNAARGNKRKLSVIAGSTGFSTVTILYKEK
jgi:predicted PurR-regulated permease PerM